MKIYALLLIKNELDIIEAVLKSALEWSDKIIVFDNGSTDGSWKKVQELAKDSQKIVPYIQDPRPFRIGLRAILFDAFKDEMTAEDWWCIRMDSDEFYLDNPKKFLAQVPFKYKQVWKSSIDFYLTKEDIAKKTFSGDFAKDKTLINHYNPYTWAEVRFIRASKKLTWNIDDFKPKPLGLIYPKQIRVLHFQFRSPQQMQKRYETRQKARIEKCGSFKHESGSSWKDYLKESEDLLLLKNDKPPIIYRNRNSFNRLHTRILKICLHFLGIY